jgi:hypothetical protein
VVVVLLSPVVVLVSVFVVDLDDELELPPDEPPPPQQV